jgi:hypothetical protein
LATTVAASVLRSSLPSLPLRIGKCRSLTGIDLFIVSILRILPKDAFTVSLNWRRQYLHAFLMQCTPLAPAGFISPWTLQGRNASLSMYPPESSR